MMNTQFIYGLETGISICIVAISLLYIGWKKQKNILVQKHNEFLHVIENTKDFIYYYQLIPERKYLYLSPSAECFFGEGSIEKAFKDPDIPIRDVHPDDYDILVRKLNGEVDFSRGIIQRWKDKDGKYRYFEEYATPIYQNGLLVALKGVLRNVDEKIHLQEELHYRLTHDALTDIYNRSFFDRKMDELNEKENLAVSIILCDLDELKYVNDNFGHYEGDLLIKETARVLNKFLSDNVTIARIGGDEFVLLISDMTKEQTEDLVESVLEELKNYNESGSEREIKLSIGIAYSDSSKGKMNELFTQADINMYKDKVNRKKEVHLVEITN